jgi:hypothetical protein
MRRTFLAVSLATLTVVGLVNTHTAAQEAKTARGKVTTLAADTVTVAVGTQDMKFTVDSKTEVEAIGAGTQTRKAVAAGQPGAKLADVIKTGMSVEVSYREAAGAMLATRIKQVPSAAPAAKPTTERSNGTVQSVTASSMTITGSSGSGASFTQTFVIDGATSVIGIGAGTAAAAAGGKVAITSLVGKGDKVNVSYDTTGTTLHAAEVRVTMKAPK